MPYVYFCGTVNPGHNPCPVLTVPKGITRLALQLGSIELARCWLANWNLVYLDRRASCHPLYAPPLTKGSGTLAYLSPPPPLGFAASGDWFTPGSAPTVSWVGGRLSRRPPGRHVSKLPLLWLSRLYRPRSLTLSCLLSRIYRVLRQLGPPSRLYRLRPFREGMLVWLCRTTEIWLPLYPRTFQN